MLFNRFSNIISIYTLHFYFTKMKHKSTKNVNNNVIKKVCVLFFFLNIVFAQDKIELKQADSLSSIINCSPVALFCNITPAPSFEALESQLPVSFC